MTFSEKIALYIEFIKALTGLLWSIAVIIFVLTLFMSLHSFSRIELGGLEVLGQKLERLEVQKETQEPPPMRLHQVRLNSGSPTPEVKRSHDHPMALSRTRPPRCRTSEEQPLYPL